MPGRRWTARRQAHVLAARAHRPLPMPSGPWVMGQTWERLLFAHWALPPAALRPLVPAPLALDTFDGAAWLGVTPFAVTGLRLRGLPPLPGLSTFLELNVRTYVTHAGRPGILFFGLEAQSAAAVLGARVLYGLPYHPARMRLDLDDGVVRYRCRRWGGGLEVDSAYAPAGPPVPSAPGTLEHFLTERYLLYARRIGRIVAAAIHHPPWPLQSAEGSVRIPSLAPTGPPRGRPLLHYAHRQDVLVWPPVRAAPGTAWSSPGG